MKYDLVLIFPLLNHQTQTGHPIVKTNSPTKCYYYSFSSLVKLFWDISFTNRREELRPLFQIVSCCSDNSLIPKTIHKLCFSWFYDKHIKIHLFALCLPSLGVIFPERGKSEMKLSEFFVRRERSCD